jgi:hypothetical protein
MADLNGPDRDRAQVMLIAAFVLAVSFIAVAVMLNSVIYTENLATRGEDARGSDGIAYRADMISGTERVIEYVNMNQTGTGDYGSDLRPDLNTSVGSMHTGTATIAAVDGIRTNVSVETTTEGRLIGQFNDTEDSRDFTHFTEGRDWELADNIQGARAFEIDINDSNELNDGSGDPFKIRIDDGGSQWEVEIYNDTSTEPVTLEYGSETCEIGGPDPEIDVIAGTVDGEACPNYEFADGVSTPYSIEFFNAHEIRGNFSVVVNSTSANSNLDDDRDSGVPFKDDAIYAATIRILHESADHFYETNAKVIPGENDA